MPEPDKNHLHTFEYPADLAEWFNQNHEIEQELWIKMFKKGTGIQSINWEEAVIEALCWGWIDGIRKSFDDQAFLQRFTPRRNLSNWSKRNREHVERLITEGRMEEPGLVHVRAARADGRWEAAYAPPSEMTIPDDFLAALKNRPKAKKHFETLNRSGLYLIGYRLATARKPETRQRRFDKFLLMLENGEKF